MRIFYALIFILSFVITHDCYSAWREHSFDETEDVFEYFKKTDKEFMLPEVKAKTGFQIAAMDSNLSSFVSLRFGKNQVDFNVSLLSAICEEPCSMYLQLLDEDRYLIESMFIGKVEASYKGDLLGKFKMPWETFCQIKYYRIQLKG